MGRKAKAKAEPVNAAGDDQDEFFGDFVSSLRALPKTFDSGLEKLYQFLMEEQEVADEIYEDDRKWKAENNELRLIGDIVPRLQCNIIEIVLAELVKTMPKEQQEALAKRVVESTGKYLDSLLPDHSEDEVSKKVHQQALGFLQKGNYMLRYMDVSTSFGAEARQDGAEGSSPGL